MILIQSPKGFYHSSHQFEWRWYGTVQLVQYLWHQSDGDSQTDGNGEFELWERAAKGHRHR
jgi:hypothetical protein